MWYAALLRGINVGGKKRVEMPRLKSTFETVGMSEVHTYINSGNVVFRTRRTSAPRMVADLEGAIEDEFGFPVRVAVRDLDAIRAVARAIPGHWVNDSTMRTNVLFLWDEHDHPEVIEILPTKEGIDEVVYVPGAVVWRVDTENVTRSGLSRIAGSDLYRGLTMRNCNTVRKLVEIMEDLAAH
jgi:uncharacterized protein (DUF1697 family)